MSTVTPTNTRRHRSRNAHSSSPAMRSRRHREATSSAGALSPHRTTPQIPVLTTQTTPGPPLPNRRNLPAPRNVTPPSAFGQSAPSWEDFDEGVFAAASKNSKRNIARTASFDGVTSKGRSFVPTTSTSYVEDEDIPMDEMMDSFMSNSPNKTSQADNTTARPQVRLGVASNRSIEASAVSSRPPIVSTAHSAAAASVNNDDGNSLGGAVEDQDTGLGRIIAALKHTSSSRPSNLTAEERVLWDSVQKAMGAVRTEQVNRKRALERQLQDSSTKLHHVSTRESELEMQLSEANTKVAQMEQQVRHSTLEDRASGVSNSRESVSKLEEQLKQSEAALKEKESGHDAEVRAIQRVLADVTTDREEEMQELADKVDALTSKLESVEAENNALKEEVEQPTATLNNMSKDTSINPEDASVLLRQKDQEIKRLEAALKKSEAEKTAAKRETDKKARRLLVQERDFKVTKVQLSKSEEVKTRLSKEAVPLKAQLETLQEAISDVKAQNQKLESDLEAKEKHVQRLKRSTPPRPEMGVPDNDSVNGSVSSEEVESLQRNLSDTSSSLENAKKIIASLENANGSLALDLRAKLKAKEEELTFVQTESADRKRHLDSLATELRDLQKKHGDFTRAEKQTRTQVFRQKALMGQLQKSMSGLQSASVVHEVSTATGQPDSANVDQVSEILSDTLVAIRSTLEMSEQYADEFDDQSVAFTDAYTDVEVNSEVGRHIDALIRNDREAAAKDLRHELDQKSSAVRRLEEALKKQNEEMKRLRAELQERNHGNGQTDKKLRAEIQSLREQCSTNMEVLAKKERELSVLRSSLKVDDENVAGYISDDSSDDEEDESASVMSPGRLNGYGPAETEALATILSNGGGIELQVRSREVETMKSELLKAHSEKEKAAIDLQSERESLANAKMIISSLEQANKGMMEDLRSRLQDSNTAIASLLDKSMDHEKASNTLLEEVERLQKEKEDGEQKLQAQVNKLKDEAKVFSLRIAAKDRQLNEKEVKSSSEEKKEEDLDDSAKVSSS